MEIKTKYFIDLLSKFNVHIVSSKSIITGNHYTAQVKDFLSFLENTNVYNLKKVDDKHTKAYFNYLIQRPKKRNVGVLSTQTVNDNLSTLRLFSLRMQEERIIERGLPIPKNLKIDREHKNDFSLTREILTINEIKEVFNACNNELERSLIALAYGSGIRRNSLVRLSETDINFSNGTVCVRKGKNNKTYTVPISEHFLMVLRKYSISRLEILSKLKLRTKSFLIDAYGKVMTGDRLNSMLKNIIKRTNNQIMIDKNITLHCLRHTIAVHLLDSGESFEYVKQYLGHAYSDTTLLYSKRRNIKSLYEI